MSPEEKPRPVYESDNNPVVRQSDLAPIYSDLRMGKWAMGALAAAVASPKLGGPSLNQIVTSFAHFLAN